MAKNEYVVTWKLFRTWLIESMTKGTRLRFLILWSILAVCSMLVFLADKSTLFLLMAFFSVYRAVIRNFVIGKKQYALMAKTYGGENWLRTVVISDADILVSEGNISIKYLNTDIVQIKEKDDKIWIVLHDKMVVRLYKSAFTEGNWEECKKFLREPLK